MRQTMLTQSEAPGCAGLISHGSLQWYTFYFGFNAY